MSGALNDAKVVHDALNTLLPSLTPAQMSNLAASLRAISPSQAKVITPANTSEMDDYGIAGVVLGGPNRRGARAVRAKVKNARVDRSKMRPLNAFIAFRSYYSTLLTGMTQKTKSGLIRTLWKQDHWKHFWAVGAKAFSELRNSSEEKLELEDFLKKVTGLLGVIPADEYLATMGWQLETNAEGEVHFVQNKFTTVKRPEPINNLSVRDVVEHCYQIGLLPRPTHKVRGTQLGQTMTMTFATRALSPNNDRGMALSSQTGEQNANEMMFGNLGTTTQTVNRGHAGGATSAAPVDMSMEFPVLRSDYAPSSETVVADQQMALEAYPSEYPYNLHFHPGIQQPALGFNPEIVQDEFDPFDISDYISFEL